MARVAAVPPAPQSPPKRVTRARARTASRDIPSEVSKQGDGAGNTGDRTKAKTKTTTVRKTSEAPETDKKPAKRGRPKATPKDTKIERETAGQDSSDDEMNVVEAGSNERAKNALNSSITSTSSISSAQGKPTRGRPKKNATKEYTEGNAEDADVNSDDDDELAQSDVPKKRATKPKSTTTSRKPRTTASESSAKPAPKRSRKTTPAVDESKKDAPKTIHISASSLAATSAVAKPKAGAGAPKKKVTFLDMTAESDKENQPFQSGTEGGHGNKIQLGIKGKPVRKTATSKSTAKGKEEPKKEPLSPKKATQVAKGGSSASDAADADNEPNRPATPIRDRSPVKKIDFGSGHSPTKNHRGQYDRDQQSSPSRETVNSAESVMMSSPAKRLPPSPYKDALKESPKRAPVALVEKQHELASAHRQESPLKASPKKGNLGASFSSNHTDAAGSPSKHKISFLQSPAKRPASPTKSLTSHFNLDKKEDIPFHFKKISPQKEGKDVSAVGQGDVKDDSDDVFNGNPIDFDASGMDIGHPLPIPEEFTAAPPSRERKVHSPTPKPETDDTFAITTTKNTVSSPVPHYETVSPEASTRSARFMDGIPPPAPSPPVLSGIDPAQFVYRGGTGIVESEDEMMVDNSPAKFKAAVSRRETIATQREPQSPGEQVGFTPLANKMSEWMSSSPEKDHGSTPQGRGIFSPVKLSEASSKAPRDSLDAVHSRNLRDSMACRRSIASSTPGHSTFFEDAMVIRNRERTALDSSFVTDAPSEIVGDEATVTAPTVHEDHILTEESEMYGDENAPPREETFPIDPQLFEEAEPENMPANEAPPTPLPMSVTPVRASSIHPRTIHTVSKVPLRPDGDGSSLNVPKKRSRSLSSSRRSLTPTLDRSKTMPSVSPRKGRAPLSVFDDSQPEAELAYDENRSPERYDAGTWPARRSRSASPTKSRTQNLQVLQGAVVYTDVHTSEGADASGIFVELLTQMGARCVKSWSWNPRTSLSPVDGVDPPREGKVGITHVVFKDGGVRTLEKVKEANGLVKCVGVGWVLDCERENRWLDESDYAVDISLIPRGGHKRRRSMEPRALSNRNGTLVKLDSSTSSASGRRSGADAETMQEFMRLSPSPSTPPSSRRDTVEWDRSNIMGANQHYALQTTPTNRSRTYDASSAGGVETPVTPDFNYAFDFDAAAAPSPTTPYYLSDRAKLVQQTCPPKQSRQGLFPMSARKEGEMSEGLKIRLDAARRKSLIWKPKVGSPLGR